MVHILVTGSTGMVGKGVLLECLEDDRIDQVTVLNRSTLNMHHPKLREVLLKDFKEIEFVADEIGKPDACFHNMGVSSVGMSEEKFTEITFELTKILVDLMFDINPNMTFTYVSGEGTDSTEQSSTMWRRVKGKTENYILNKGFDKAVMFRPGFIIPEKGIKSSTKLYQFFINVFRPFFPLLKKLENITSTTTVGKAMINVHFKENFSQKHLESREINSLA